jgi:GPH family glycoside/pentoside/hexuronide:cation symporter
VISASNIFLFYYYHAIVGLEPLLIFLATAIITIWYTFNDPLIGYLTDRNFKWTRRWGRHFPFIIVGAIPWCFSLVLIYSAPDARVNPWPAFLWFMMANGISETLLTTSDVSVGALRVDKFRTEGERRKYSFFFTPLDMIALVIGMTIPPLLLGFAAGNASYTIMALLVRVIALFFVLLFLPGAREDKIIIDRYYSREYKSMTFLKGISQVLKQRSFVSFWIQYATFGVATTIMTAMVVYLTTFILQVPTGDMTILFGISIIGALLSVP